MKARCIILSLCFICILSIASLAQSLIKIDSIEVHTLSFGSIKFNDLIPENFIKQFNLKIVIVESVDESDIKHQIKYLTDGKNYFRYNFENRIFNILISNNVFEIKPFEIKIGDSFENFKIQLPNSSSKSLIKNKYRYLYVTLYSKKNERISYMDGNLIFVFSAISDALLQIQFKPIPYDEIPSEL